MKIMSDLGVHRWMSLEALSCAHPHHYVVIYVSPHYIKHASAITAISSLPELPKTLSEDSIRSYVRQYIDAGNNHTTINGCAFEMLLLTALVRRTPEARKRIMFLKAPTASPRTALEFVSDTRYHEFADSFFYRPVDIGRLASCLIGRELQREIPL
eukprot:TRINITY_DN9784_c0_g1_i1.p1 TRINITY_DN9784_c0_g1~~TRINITY_DN9784_c0_g1_i1.p1  ORF type:complete len:156 (-),score=7.37 TRINITY_DN9784_c0_g1_i1:555-1022(-)